LQQQAPAKQGLSQQWLRRTKVMKSGWMYELGRESFAASSSCNRCFVGACIAVQTWLLPRVIPDSRGACNHRK
jgi:hypothetical protein